MMIQSGQDGITPIDFESRLDRRLPVEVVDWAETAARLGPAHVARPQRLNLHLFLLCRSDGGAHVVDFDEIGVCRGRLIQVRSGQVQAWATSIDIDATLVLAKPATINPGPWFPGDRVAVDLDDAGLATAERLIAVLLVEQVRFDGSVAANRLLVALFEALTALFDLATSPDVGTRLPEPYLAFRQAIETDLARSHDITDHAVHLGYSPRTINRACQQATGQTAKQVLSERLALEAKRLLAHSDASAASIAATLGFSEPTNFSKFFARMVGTTPTAFRSDQSPDRR